MCVHGRIDFVSADIQIILSQSEFVFRFINRIINKGLVTLFAFRRLIVVVHRFGLVHLLLGNVALLIHQLEHHTAPFLRKLRITQRVVAGWPLRHCSKRGHLPNLEFVQITLAKIPDGCRLDPVNGAAEVDAVQIFSNNLFFGEFVLQRHGDRNLGRFAEEGLIPGKENVLRQLLGNRTAAFDHASRSNILHCRPADRP
ncbi:hypothetical protein D3C73_723290 [compost metagenome]